MSPSRATAAAGHQRTVRRRPAPPRPRRVSGPARQPKGRVAPSQAGLGRALPARAGSVSAPADSLGPRLVRGLGAIAEHHLLDRLLRGRAWIVIVAIGLIGLVFMQVSLLKINAGMGAAVERAAELERKNAGLRAAVAQLDANERLQVEAVKLGMVLPAAGDVTFLGSDGRRVGGDAPAVVPSEAAASTAVLPTLPGEEQATAAAPETTAPAPQTTAPAPETTAPAATAPAPATTAPAAGSEPTATEAAAPPPETTTQSPVSTAGGAAVPE